MTVVHMLKSMPKVTYYVWSDYHHGKLKLRGNKTPTTGKDDGPTKLIGFTSFEKETHQLSSIQERVDIL